MDEGDWQLAARCAAGDKAALEVLYRQYVGRIWRYAYLRTHSREAAAEIVQETFLRVVRSVGGFEGRSGLGTWLYAVARSAAIDYARRQRREQAKGVEPVVLKLVPAAAVADPVQAGETQAAVRRAVADLPGRQRDAVVLYELMGASIREVAGVLGWTESRVKVTLFRARRALRETLRDYVAGGGLRATNG